MSVNPRPTFAPAVIEMKCFDLLRSDNVVELPHGGSIFLLRSQRVTGGKDVTRIKTDPESLGRPDAFEQRGEMFEAPAEIRTLPGGSFEQAGCLRSARFAIHFIQCANDASQSMFFGGAHEGAWVDHEVGDAQLLDAQHLNHKGINRPLPERIIGAGKVDQI